MTTTDTPTLDHVLTLATRLPPADKLRLIEHLAPQVANALPSTPEPSDLGDAVLMELDALVAESLDLGSAQRDSADVLSEMRR